jgi:hypothetical protein
VLRARYVKRTIECSFGRCPVGRRALNEKFRVPPVELRLEPALPRSLYFSELIDH